MANNPRNRELREQLQQAQETCCLDGDLGHECLHSRLIRCRAPSWTSVSVYHPAVNTCCGESASVTLPRPAAARPVP